MLNAYPSLDGSGNVVYSGAAVLVDSTGAEIDLAGLADVATEATLETVASAVRIGAPARPPANWAAI